MSNHICMNEVEADPGSEYQPYDADTNEEDDLYVDDKASREVFEHVTNLENPTNCLWGYI